ncbi:MAG: sensor histidine kinase, partial [Thermodesulfovibrionales bacterium]
LLNFARQSSSPLRNIKEADINNILTDVLKPLQTEIEKHGINVITDFGQIPAARVDVRQIEQAILNIILNAIQAVKNNGEIRIRTYTEKNSIKIEISDNGPGIPEDIKPRIFDPFFTTKPVGEGTGLGLSISAGIISEHGGSIDVESMEGNGATFIITLPAASASS